MPDAAAGRPRRGRWSRRRADARPRVRATVAVAALAGAASMLAVSPAVEAAPPRATGWAIARTGRGAVPLTGRLAVRAGSSEATAVLFALTGARTGRRMSNAFTTARIDWGVDGSQRVYGALLPQCQVACSDPVAVPFEYGFSSNGHRTDATIYVALWDVASATVTVTAPGWRVTRWTPAMRVVTTDAAGDVGARVLRTSAGRFVGAAAPGGRYGSLGWTRLPCEMHGEGNARFTGGRRPYPLDCDVERSALEEATGPTEWRLTGAATGVSSIVNVLVVVDYPRVR